MVSTATDVMAPAPAGLTPYLAAVEELFRAELRSALPQVQQLLAHVERFRGKMLRPTLVLLAGLAAQPEATADRPVPPLGETHLVLATVVEMVHLATLVHDDVLDQAEIRRRGATVNHLHGNEIAVLLGDWLISHAYYLCSSRAGAAAARLIGQTTNIVCEGELAQNFNRGNWSLREGDYFDIIYRKTGSLIETACRIGAAQTTSDRSTVEALARYGRQVGVAFQIIDDVLDLTGQAKAMGKSLGTDIDRGKLTLPLIHFLATAAPTHRELLIGLLESPEADRVERVRQLLIPSVSVAYARRRAEILIAQALAAIDILPASDARERLRYLARMVITRQG